MSPPFTETHDSDWYRRAFQSGYLGLYSHRNEADARRAVDFLAGILALSSARLLDLCCGAGRHLRLIAPRVPFAVGLDLSRPLLAEAHSAPSSSLPQRLIAGDMRRLPFADRSFDLVLNLFTSFGYFASDGDNQAVLHEVARLLASGGTLVLDHINRPRLESTLQPSSERELAGGVRVIERRHFDPDSRRVNKHVRWHDPSAPPAEWTESVRVYDSNEIADMLRSTGLIVTRFFGDYDGSDLGADSDRMILLARRDS